MSIQRIRERINLKIYGSKAVVMGASKWMMVLISLITLATLIYYHGFPQTVESKNLLILVVQGSFAFYIFNYLLKIFYSFEPLKLIRDTWFEGLLMAFLIVEGISYNLYGNLILSEVFIQLGINNITHYYALFIQLYFLFIVLAKLVKTTNILPNIKIHPSNIFIASFLLIIFGGTGLLMLPEMTTIPGSMPFIDALFTSTSATCVTGLIVADTPTYFAFKGQFIIMILMKLGGLNIIAFGSFFALASKFGVGLKQHSVLEDFVNKDSILSSKGMLGKVIIWSIMIEAIGTIMLFFFWSDKIPFTSFGNRLFISAFHSFSAFNNAGFSMFTDGLGNDLVKDNYAVHNIITILVFFGALGFMTIFDMFDPAKLKERAKYPWKQLSFGSKIALYFSLGLVAFGAIMYYFLEADNTLHGKSAVGIITTSLFQSVTRTSGFNTVDIGSIGIPMLIILIFLMFVGSSSSSTGGGIKTSTFALLWASTIATIRGRKNSELFQKTISTELIFRAYSVFLFFIVGNLVSIFLLAITETNILAMEGRSLLDLIFEEVSAFGTVGLSTGITSYLSNYGKVIIIVSMFVGRVGTLTVAFAFGKKAISTRYKYPNGHTMVA
jgi:Trk-type K+ transport system membrane component